MYSDQPGRFPNISQRKNQYVMVAVKLDGNYIDAELLKTRKANNLTKAYQCIYQRWKATSVICPNWHILNNESPEEFKQAILENKCWVELTPADIAQEKHSRKSNCNIQRTFHFTSRTTFQYGSAGWTHFTNSTYLELALSVSRGSKHLRIRISPRQLRLQFGADGMRSTIPYQA